MSVRMMARVWPLDVPANQKIVLLALADVADDKGACWPSDQHVASKCSMSRRNLQRLVNALALRGLVGVVRREGKENVFVLRLPESTRVVVRREPGRPRGAAKTQDKLSGVIVEKGGQDVRGISEKPRTDTTKTPDKYDTKAAPPLLPPPNPNHVRIRTEHVRGSVNNHGGSGSGRRGVGGVSRVGEVLAGAFAGYSEGRGGAGEGTDLAGYVAKLLRKLAIRVPEGYDPGVRQCVMEHKQFKGDVVTVAKIAGAAIRGRFGDNGQGWLTGQCEQLAGSPEGSRMRLLVWRVKERLRRGGLSWAAM